jgi:hypothetical protein
MGKNHGQNTRTIWPERPSPTATLPLLISSGYRTRRAGISYSAPYLIPFRSIRREHYRSEYPPGTKITGPRIHSTRSRETSPAPAAGKSPLHQVRASPGREPDPFSLPAPVNSNYPAPILPGQLPGRQARCPRTSRLYRLHRTRGRPLQSSGRTRPRRPAATYQTRRDAFAILPRIYRSPGTPGALPRGRPGRLSPAGGDGGRRRVQVQVRVRVRVRGRLAGRPARRDMIDTTRIGDRRPRPGPIFRPGPQDHQPPDISSSNGLKCRSPIFVAPEAIGPEDQ